MTPEEFGRRWRRFVARWDVAERPEGRNRLVDDLLLRGLVALTEGSGSQGTEPRHTAQLGDRAMLRCEIAVVRRSGAVALRAYAKANPETKRLGQTAIEHFCKTGWRHLRNPNRNFDVWWYWAEYLDPRTESVNPLLHFLTVGRFQGLDPVPPRGVGNPPARYEAGYEPKRICLFAAFDADGLVDDCLVDYVSELSRHADVFYLADGYVYPEELQKLAGITRGAWGFAHGAYDFGSYSILARDLVGWDLIREYDELVLANDSAYLLRSLDNVFKEMDSRPCDWWGLQATRHDFDRDSNQGRPLPLAEAKRSMIGERFMSDIDHLHVSSYFLVYRRPVIEDSGFRRRLDSVVPQSEKPLVIYKYEIGLSRYLMCRGFDFDTFIADLYPFHPLYTEQYFELLDRGFPLLKRNFISENSRNVADLVHWQQRVLARVPDAPVSKIEDNLLRVSPDDRLQRSLSLVTNENGVVRVPKPLSKREIIREDQIAPKFDHWWVFPVSSSTHQLTGEQRAVFEEVADDPSIKKIVLSRGRRLSLEAENVVIAPLFSNEGQNLLVRAGHVFTAESPETSVPFPLRARRRRFIHVASAPRLERRGREGGSESAHVSDDRGEVTCQVATASSAADALAATVCLNPRPPREVFIVGALRNDLILRPFAELPKDLQAQEMHLRDLVGGRRLILVVPSRPDGGGDSQPSFLSSAEVEHLAEWCEAERAVLGFQDWNGDRSRQLSQMLHPVGALNLGDRDFPYTEMLDRVASAMISDHSDRLVEFAATGKPLVALVRSRGDELPLYHDLDLALPRQICADFPSLMAALQRIFDVPSDEQRTEYARMVRYFHAFLDHDNARRLVGKIKETYLEEFRLPGPANSSWEVPLPGPGSGRKRRD